MEKNILLRRANAFIDSKKSFKIHILVFLFTAPAIWLVWHLTGSTYQWHLWIMAGWVKGLQFHFLRAFLYKSAAFQKLQLWVRSKTVHNNPFRTRGFQAQ